MAEKPSFHPRDEEFDLEIKTPKELREAKKAAGVVRKKKREVQEVQEVKETQEEREERAVQEEATERRRREFVINKRLSPDSLHDWDREGIENYKNRARDAFDKLFHKQR